MSGFQAGLDRIETSGVGRTWRSGSKIKNTFITKINRLMRQNTYRTVIHRYSGNTGNIPDDGLTTNNRLSLIYTD